MYFFCCHSAPPPVILSVAKNPLQKRCFAKLNMTMSVVQNDIGGAHGSAALRALG